MTTTTDKVKLVLNLLIAILAPLAAFHFAPEGVNAPDWVRPLHIVLISVLAALRVTVGALGATGGK